LLDKMRDPESHRQATPPPAILTTGTRKVTAAAIAAIRHNRGLVVVTPFARLAWWLTRLSPSLIEWGAATEASCDRCGRPIFKLGEWVAYWNPYAVQGVRLLCVVCWDSQPIPLVRGRDRSE